jgi:hypothetical protein
MSIGDGGKESIVAMDNKERRAQGIYMLERIGATLWRPIIR